MALIRCPECGREKVSDTAEMCPECGYGIRAHIERVKIENERKRMEEEQRRKENEERKRREERELFLRQQGTSSEEVEQEETIEMLEAKMKQNKQGFHISIAFTIIFGLLLVWAWNASVHGSHGILIVIFFFTTCGSAMGIFSYNSACTENATDIQVAEMSMQAYKQRVQKRTEQQAEKAKQAAERYELAHPQCPHCGSKNTQKILTIDRATSVALTGLASGKIGKQYECKHCGHKW